MDHPGAGFDLEEGLAEELGAEPNMDAFNHLYTPPVEHATIERDPEDEDGWRAKRILVDDVCIRYTDDMDHLSVIVEGDLAKSMIEPLATDLQAKLALVENTSCRIKWIN